MELKHDLAAYARGTILVDGHHRWAAYRMKAPKKPMEVVVIDAPIRDVLGMAIDWGAGHSAF